MGIPARLIESQSLDRRGATRRRLALGSSLQTTDEDVSIHDLSSNGMLIETSSSLALGDDLQIELPQAGVVDAFVVWASGRYFGCAFRHSLSKAAISAALLRGQRAVPQLELKPPPASGAVQPKHLDDRDDDDDIEERASLGVRLRVILGLTIVLWMLIFWAVASLVKFARVQLG